MKPPITVQRMGAGANSYELIQVPNLLKEKVGEGGIDPDVLLRANAAVEALGAHYLDWISDDIRCLEKLLEKAKNNRSAYSEIYDKAHDMKGQGGTFGYPLVSRIGRCLSDYIEELADGKQIDQAILAAHIDALRSVVQHQAKGTDHAIGNQIALSLEELVRRKRR